MEMDATPKLAIVLAAYNGEQFIGAQIDSILTQTYRNFILVIHDDGSADDTVKIIASYVDAEPERVRLIPTSADAGSASKSFSHLTQYVLDNKQALGLDRAYIMYCDQDDCWMPDKVQRQMQAMVAGESAAIDTPLLVHSDLVVVSESLEEIAPSYMVYQGLEKGRADFPHMLISNLVTGCTALINEALARRALPVPDTAIMHDWWLALVASALGHTIYIDAPLVRYRQHGSNAIGAKQHVPARLTPRSIRDRLLDSPPNDYLVAVAVQAGQFRRTFGASLSARQRLACRISALMGIRSGILQRILFRIMRRF